MLSFAAAQTPDSLAKPVILSGDVTSVDASKIVITTKDGPIEIQLAPKTIYKRVSAEKPDLSTAAVVTLDEISVGDKVAISVLFGADKKPQPARTVYLMTKADITQRQTKETQEWRTRGITGRVTAVDALAGKITVEQRGLTGSTTITVTPKESVKYLRYAPDSIKFSEAKESSIAEIKPGDMIRALGDRGTDGTTFAAEEVVSGAFQTRAGKVKSIDAEKGEIVVTDLASNKDLTIAVAPTSIMKKFPEDQAQRMAQRPVAKGAPPRLSRGDAGRSPCGGGGSLLLVPALPRTWPGDRG